MVRSLPLARHPSVLQDAFGELANRGRAGFGLPRSWVSWILLRVLDPPLNSPGSSTDVCG